MANESFNVFNFSGGLSTKLPPHLIQDNQFLELSNLNSDDSGALVRRRGYERLNATDYGSVGKSIWKFEKKNGSQYLLIGHADKVSKFEIGVDTDFSDIYTTATPNLRYSSTQNLDRAIFSNGPDGIKYWTGSAVYDLGVAPPSGNPSGTQLVGGGSLSAGTYKYQYTFVYEFGQESNPSPASSGILVGLNDRITVTSIGVGGANVVARKLYRTTANGAVYDFVTEISDNVTTSYIDGLADVDLGANVPLDNGVPDPYYLVTLWNGRIIGARTDAEPAKLGWSQTNMPDIWNALDFLTIGNAAGKITKIMPYFGGLLVMKEHESPYIIQATNLDDPTTITVRKMDVNVGNFAQDSVVEIDKRILFFSDKYDVRGLSGTVDDNADATRIDNIKPENMSEIIEPTILGFDSVYYSEAAGADFDNKYWLTMRKTTGSYNDVCLIYDYRRGSWWQYDNVPFNSFVVLENKLYAISSKIGFVYQVNIGDTDDGDPIEYLARSKYYAPVTPFKWKYYSQFYYSFAQLSSAEQITISYSTNFEIDPLSKVRTYQLQQTTNLWGSSTWSGTYWGGLASVVDTHPCVICGKWGYYISWLIQGTSTQSNKFKLYGFEMLYHGLRTHR